MDEKLFFHTVATETAKAYTSSNMPEYVHEGASKFAEDFSVKYFEAYKAAKEFYDKNRIQFKSDGLL